MAFLTEVEAYEMLQSHGVSPVPYCFVQQADAAVHAAEQLGYPVVMKIVSEDIVHKSDAGCVVVGISCADEAVDAYAKIMGNAESAVPGGRHKGILVSKMISGGTEVIIGGGIDPEFGRFLMFGLGGVFVELYKDVVFRGLPLNNVDAHQMISQTRASRLLEGYRGQSVKDVDALHNLLLKCSHFFESEPDVTEMDLNPVMVCEQGVYVLDARINVQS